jgi:hypothetical protein
LRYATHIYDRPKKKLIKKYIESHPLIQSQYDGASWCFHPQKSRDIISVWANSTLFYPHPNQSSHFDWDLFTHEYMWLGYTGPYYDHKYFNWEEALTYYPLTLKSFFIQQRIDTPVFLKQKRAKHLPSFKYPAAQLVGMLARHGQHKRIWRSYFDAYNKLVNHYLFPISSKYAVRDVLPTLNFALVFPSLVFNSLKFDFSYPDYVWTEDDDTSHPMLPDGRYDDEIVDTRVILNEKRYFHRALLTHMKQYLPIFAMKFRKVDKLRFKHSRGKSGKYMVEWKYVPVYKRLNIVLRWLTEDIVLQRSLTFKGQIYNSFNTLLTSPRESSVKRNRNYVHKYVYARYKNSLIRSLKKIH